MKNGCLWSVKTFLLFDFFFAWHSGFISLMSGPWHAMMIHRRVHRGRLVRNFFHVTIRFFSQYEIRLQKLHKNDQKKKITVTFFETRTCHPCGLWCVLWNCSFTLFFHKAIEYLLLRLQSKLILICGKTSGNLV